MTRSYGGGTVHKQADGRWYGQISLGTDAHGRRRRKTVRGDTRNEVLRLLRQIRSDHERGEHVVTNESTTWGAACDAYEAHLAARVATGALSPTTQEWSVSVLRHGRRLLGEHRRVTDVRASHVEQMTATLAREGKAPSTVRAVHGVVRSVLALAVRDGLLRSNPATLVPTARGERAEARHLTADEFRALYAAATGPMRTAVLLMGTLGLRRGEALALLWDDVDLDAGVLHVRATLTRTAAHGLARTAPKTRTSRRTLPLAAPVVAALRPLRGLPAAPVVPSPTGGLWEPRNFGRAFTALATHAGLPDVTAHALRHTVATEALAAGEPVVVVSSLLGHASARTTLGVYAHVVAEQRQTAADTVAGRLLG